MLCNTSSDATIEASGTRQAGNRKPFDYRTTGEVAAHCIDGSTCGMLTPSGAGPAEEAGATEGGKRALLATGKERKNSMSLTTENEDEATMNEVSRPSPPSLSLPPPSPPSSLSLLPPPPPGG